MPPIRSAFESSTLIVCTEFMHCQAEHGCVIDFTHMMEIRARTIATRESWINYPLPEQRVALSLQRDLTEEEYQVIRYGLIPQAMEDKWFIFLEQDILYVHRSWTGNCIYQLRLRKDGANYTVTEALANRDVSQYKWADDGYDEKLLTFLIDCLLLGRSSTFPVPAGVPPGIATATYHHHIAAVGPNAREAQEPISALGWLWAWVKWLIRGLVRR